MFTCIGETMKTKGLISSLGALALSVSLLVPIAASANGATSLPPGASGDEDTGRVLLFACPNELHFWAPMPYLTDGNQLSNRDPLYRAFRWRLSATGEGTNGTANQLPWMPLFSHIPPEADGPWNVGQLLEVDVEGLGTDDGSFTDLSASNFFIEDLAVMDPDFESGSGTEQDPYLVHNQDELNKLRCHFGAHFKLANDIALTGNWLPIGNAASPWQGFLDGAGHTISGLNIQMESGENVGLFGYVSYASVRNLRIEAPTVVGAKNVGVLFGFTQDGGSTNAFNVVVTDAVVSGVQLTGGLVGDFGGGSISKVDFTGEVNARRAVGTPGSSGSPSSWDGIKRVGGLIGEIEVSAAVQDIRVDVQLSIAEDLDYRTRANNQSISLSGSETRDLGLLAGIVKSGVAIDNLDLTGEISIEVFSSVSDVGGVAGYIESPISRANVDVVIKHVTLGGMSDGSSVSSDSFGGGFGRTTEFGMNRSKVRSELHVMRGTALNNRLEVVAPESNSFQVRRVGGLAGYAMDNSQYRQNRVDTEIRISDANNAYLVGGLIGEASDGRSMAITENVATGSISVSASDRLEQVAGFGNMEYRGSSAGFANVAAVEITVGGGAVPTGIHPFFGEVNHLERQALTQSYWDSEITSLPNGTDYPALAATTAQLNDASFLAAAGFNMLNVWKLDGNYPDLRSHVFSDTEPETVFVSVPVSPRVTLVPAPSASLSQAGGNLNLSGEGLRGLGQVMVGERSLFVQVLSDTQAVAMIPSGLPFGPHNLTLVRTDGSRLEIQNAFSIVATGAAAAAPGYWTKLQQDGTVKIYAKDIVGIGKVQFFHNNQEVAWVRAVEATDPKLLKANGAHYMVRTRELVAGKNSFEIYVDGARVWRTAYSK